LHLGQEFADFHIELAHALFNAIVFNSTLDVLMFFKGGLGDKLCEVETIFKGVVLLVEVSRERFGHGQFVAHRQRLLVHTDAIEAQTDLVLLCSDRRHFEDEAGFILEDPLEARQIERHRSTYYTIEEFRVNIAILSQKPYSFGMQMLHLRGRKRCDAIRTKGIAWKGKHLVVRWMKGVLPSEKARPEGSVYVGSFAGAKLDKSAVRRNRMRRRCKEAFRLGLAKTDRALPPTCLLISPRSSSLDCAFDELERDAISFLSTLR
jgi:ribonuclease P protein component